jgi:hypothetical protein
MMNPSSDPSPSEDLQFDKVSYKGGEAPQKGVCQQCRQPLPGSYFQVNGAVMCLNCKDQISTFFQSQNASLRVGKALAFGIPTAALGAGIYYAISALTGYEFGLIAILIGWMVGAVVRKGSGYRGGLPYQIIAVLLTYMAICATYVPYIIAGIKESMKEEQLAVGGIETDTSGNLDQEFLHADSQQTTATQIPDTAGAGMNSADTQMPRSWSEILIAYALVFALALVAPFLSGFSNILGLLIIGFGLFEAWKMNKKVLLDIQGPYELKT